MAREPPDKGVAGRIQRSTPDLLRNLRSLRVMVFHPKDADSELLTQQLQRIGCQVTTTWPPLPELPHSVDVVYCAVRPDHAAIQCAWMGQDSTRPLIAIVSYENPTIVDAAMRMGSVSVLASPIRSAGILSSLAMAQHTHAQISELQRRNLRLQQKLLGANQVSQAKAILVRTRGVSDTDAYRIIREQAMSKRVPTEEIARAIIQADDVLSFAPKNGG